MTRLVRSTWLLVLLLGSPLLADDFTLLTTEYAQQVQPLLKKYCLECHTTADKAGELDLERYADLAAVRLDPAPWQRALELLGNGEMPPEDSPQPSPQERQQLQDWVRRYLDAEALASAGDPGPVVLRRLNNAELTYTLEDLLGVDLKPAEEFPVDGAAGEGFTNTGASLVMSPSLVEKYLTMGKRVAGHAVLLPDGIRFSAGETRSDWTNEIVDEIRSIYIRHTTGNADVSALDRWSVADPKQATRDDGRVDLTPYFAVMIEHRDALLAEPERAAAFAREAGVNGKYLSLIVAALSRTEGQSVLLQDLRNRWLKAGAGEAPALAATVRAWQDRLWRFNTVGHFGSIRPFQAPDNPLPEQAALRVPLAGEASILEVTLQTATTGGLPTSVMWQRPRIEFKDRPAILLKDIPQLVAQVESRQAQELPRTEQYLTAIVELNQSSEPLVAIAQRHQLDPHLLQQWTKLVGIGQRAERTIAGHMTNQLRNIAGYSHLNGWDMGNLPSMMANSSTETIQFSTLTVPPRCVTLHPLPTVHAAVAWVSPYTGKVRLSGQLADADNKCGNGYAWQVEQLSTTGRTVITQGEADNGGNGAFASQADLDVAEGDIISLILLSRNNDHSCDTTHVQWTLKSADDKFTWDISQDVVDHVLEGNRLPDQYGHPDVWQFYTLSNTAPASPALPAESALARWQGAVRSGQSGELSALAKQVQQTLSAAAEGLSVADQEVRGLITNWTGPLQWTAQPPQVETALSGVFDTGVSSNQFGVNRNGGAIEAASFAAQAPHALTIRLPANLVQGGEFVVEAVPVASGEETAGLQARAVTGRTGIETHLLPGEPLLSPVASPVRKNLEAAYDEFRAVFPATMCYARIVPVDEVVTLVLFHREDEPLARLMLGPEEQQRLDRLWTELRYVSRDTLTITIAYEQLMEFATQDADPTIFEPLRQPIQENAQKFRQWLSETEPQHVNAVLRLAEQAFRRPLSAGEQEQLQALYGQLREAGLEHEASIQLLIARVLTSPTFLYKTETPGPGKEQSRLSDGELATRLSYLLWSSTPDAQLRTAATAGNLQQDDILLQQTRRMLQDSRVRRLALEFGCQWLHVREFDQHGEKSEEAFPDFLPIRASLHEEGVQFFTHLFQQDASILDILNADYVFVNEPLAKYYGIPGVQGEAWQRIPAAGRFGRGGILTWGSTLATQSGASRTSPILRGNWVYETILGERLPRPPKNVPQLPENVPSGLTERQLTELHSSAPACVKCHIRVDPFGFALESYDGIGRHREVDAAGLRIDTATKLGDGTPLQGFEGLRDYLVTTRREAFVRQFCKKLLGYALGRRVQLSDEPLLRQMQDNLAANDYKFSAALEPVVLSDQFRCIRGAEHVDVQEE